jgi:uncharacterized repeat protein (TIGR01451 family)
VHTLEGIVYDVHTLRGIPDVRIEAILQPSGTLTLDRSDAAGAYDLHLTTGTYTITAQIYGYSARTLTLPITRDAQVDIALTPVPLYQVAGQIFDAHTGYPLRAHIAVAGTPLDPPTPGHETWSQQVTGRYTLDLAEGNTYTLSVTAQGYAPHTRTVGPLTDDILDKDFALYPDLVACTAPGYESGLSWTTILSEDFEAPWPREGWTVVRINPNGGKWEAETMVNYTGGYGWCAEANGNEDDEIDAFLQSPALDLSDFKDAQMTFKFATMHNSEPVGNRATVGLSPDAGVTWPITLFQRYQTQHTAETITLSLAAAAGEPDARVRFRYQTPDHGWYQVDEVRVRGTPCEPALDAVRLYPAYLEDEACACTTHSHPITFVNHSGLTDTVLITYTASPSLTVLDLPDTLGLSPDGAITPFEVTVHIHPHAPPGSTVYVTLTTSLAAHPHLSDTIVMATYIPLITDWEAGTDSPVGVSDHALIVRQGFLYQVGGTVDGTTGISDVLRYDPATDTWAAAETPMDLGLYMIDGGAIDGGLYILGGAVDAGTTEDHVQIYDISAGDWHPGAEALRSRVGYATVAMDGLLYRIGGGDPATGDFASQRMDTYDPITDVWDTDIPYPWYVRWPCAGAIDGKIYVAGGLNGGGQGLGSAAVYDTSDWHPDQMADLPLGVTLWGAADFVHNGKLICAGGARGGLTGQITHTVWIYDPGADRWNRGADLYAPIARAAAAALDAGYIVGGCDPASDRQATLTRSAPCPDCRCQLEITKTGPDRAYADPVHPRVISYTIAIHNSGEVTTTATLTDTLPPGIDYADGLRCQGGAGTCHYTPGLNSVVWQGEIAPRETLTVTFDVTVTATISPQVEASVVNTAKVGYLACNGGEPPASHITSTHTLRVSAPPTLTWARNVYINNRWVGRSAQSPFTVMRHDTLMVVDILTYTGVLSRFVTLAEHWPSSMLINQSGAHTTGVMGLLPDGAYGWGVTLKPNSRATLTRTFAISQTGVITLTGWLTPTDMPTGTPGSLPLQSRTVVLMPLGLQKYGPTLPETGSVITYTIVLDHADGLNGPVWVTDTLPTGVRFAGMVTPTHGTAWYSPTVGSTGHVVYWELVDGVHPPAYITLTLNVAITAAPRARVTNTVEARYHNKTLTDSISLDVPYAEITVTPRTRHAIINPQATTTRTLTISNTGTGRLTWAITATPTVGWLNITPSITGTVAPASSTRLNLLLSAYDPDTDHPLDDGTYTTTLSVTSNDRDVPIIPVPITLTVQSGCIPVSELTFTVVPLAPQAGAALSFTAHATQGTGSITYTWAFGDNTSPSTGSVVTHTYPLSGTYTVILTATNACGTAAITRSLYIVGTPDLNLTPTMLNVVLKPEAVTTRTLSMSNDGTADLHWDIEPTPAVPWLTPDPTSGVIAPDDQIYVDIALDAHTLAGDTYTTTLVLHSDDPAAPVITIPVTLLVTTTCQPVAGAAFIVDPPTPTAGAPITFTASVTEGSTPIAYTWHFPQDFPAIRQSSFAVRRRSPTEAAAPVVQGHCVTHTYPVSGTYTVILTATNACSTETITRAIHVKGTPHITLTPSALHAALRPDDMTVRPLSIINFGTADLHWDIVPTPAVSWLTLAPASGVIPPDDQTHVDVTFDAHALIEGTYTTTLTLHSDDPTVPFIAIPVTLVVTTTCQPVAGAAFIVDPATPMAGAPITLTAGVMRGSEPITYSWYFPQHVLAVHRVVSQATSLTAVHRDSLAVHRDSSAVRQDPSAVRQDSFAVRQDSFAVRRRSLTEAHLQFAQGRCVTYTYPVSGTYTVLMTATNACGMDTTTELIHVSGEADLRITSPSLNITQTNYIDTQPDSTLRHSLSIHNVGTANLHWQMREVPAAAWLTVAPDSGVLAPAASTDVAITVDTHPLAPGTYTTTLILHSNDPDASPLEISIALMVTTTCQPVTGAAFTVDPATPTAGAPITFTASVTAGSAPITYTWNLAHRVSSVRQSLLTTPLAVRQDSLAVHQSSLTVPLVVRRRSPTEAAPLVIQGQQITHTYPVSGTYTVLVTATNACGQVTTTRDVVVIGQPDLHLAPDKLDVVLHTGTVISRFLTLDNRGTSALHWKIDEAPPRNWLIATPTLGIIVPNAAQGITLTLDARDLTAEARPHTMTLHLHSNAPDAPLIALPITLTMTSPPSPCIPIAGAVFTHTPSIPKPREAITLTGTITQGTRPITYTWDLRNSGHPLLIGNPITLLLTTPPTTYTITMHARNPCPSTESITHTILLRPPRTPIYLPLVLRNCRGETFHGD